MISVFFLQSQNTSCIWRWCLEHYGILSKHFPLTPLFSKIITSGYKSAMCLSSGIMYFSKLYKEVQEKLV